MSLFISTTFYKDKKKVTDVLNILQKLNVKNVELGSNHIWQSNIEKNIKKYNFNYLVHNYFPVPKKNLIINIASKSTKTRLDSIRHIKNSILFSKKIKAKIYTFHPGFIEDPISESDGKKNYDFKFKKFTNSKKKYEECFQNMIISLKEISTFAKKNNISLSIETEGSRKKNFCFMYHYDEYLRLYKFFSNKDFGLNLNIGHLNLAYKLLKFRKSIFIKKLKKYIVAFELSHNNGLDDQHLPLKKNAWYWKYLNMQEFSKIPKILEFRNTAISDLKSNIELFKYETKKI